MILKIHCHYTLEDTVITMDINLAQPNPHPVNLGVNFSFKVTKQDKVAKVSREDITQVPSWQPLDG